MSSEDAIARRLLLSFRGTRPPGEVVQRLRKRPFGGVTLYRSLNVSDVEQLAQLTTELQQNALEPLLIGTDQEGGQLTSIGDATPFPGNLALGATGSAELARAVGECIGTELAAIGINTNYAPVCDVNSNPDNPVVGVRSFGEDAAQVGALSTAFIAGLQSKGIAATAKHFPGHGDTSIDSHYGIPVVHRLELEPFRAAIAAGVQLVMVGHLAVPALTGRDDLPATVSRKIVTELLREQLAFNAVTVSDALDMAALSQDLSAIVEAAAAGIDLLLMGPRALDIDALLERLTEAETSESDARIIALKRWVAEHRLQPQPPLTVVGCAEHSAVAKQVAEDSITLVRDVGNLLPLALAADQRLVLVLPKLADLTPADTSSSVRHTLAEHVRRYVPRALAIEVAADPTDAEIGSVRGQLRSNDVVLLATVNARAQVGQVRLAATVLKTAGRVVVAALRMPTDLLAFPGVATYLCTYSAQEPSLSALADVLFGKLRPRGKLPVSIPGMYPVGHATHLPGPIP